MTDEDLEKLSPAGRDEYCKLAIELGHTKSALSEAEDTIQYLRQEISDRERDYHQPPEYRRDVKWLIPISIFGAWLSFPNSATIFERISKSLVYGSTMSAWLLWITVVVNDLGRYIDRKRQNKSGRR